MLRQHPRLMWLLSALFALAGCGGQPGAALDVAHAQPPIASAPAAHATPLNAGDIDLYLQVMRVAAQRVQHPSPPERQMLARADAITDAANRGDIHAMAADGNDVLSRALAFHMQMDLDVAKAQHLDPVHYQALSERIEDESGELYCNAAAPVPDSPALKPHVAEIEHLVGIVRNPGPVGSPPIPPACADGGDGHT